MLRKLSWTQRERQKTTTGGFGTVDCKTLELLAHQGRCGRDLAVVNLRYPPTTMKVTLRLCSLEPRREVMKRVMVEGGPDHGVFALKIDTIDIEGCDESRQF